MIILNIRNAQQSGKETEQILQAINHKDFSLFPDKKQNDPLKQKAVDLYYQEKRKIPMYCRSRFCTKIF